MIDQYDSGISLKDDIAAIRTDPTFHDVVIVCADGVEIGACRAILASRSAVFKAMLYGSMQESISGKVFLHDVKSAAMHAVLRFIHTEDIEPNTVSIAVEVYRAASFLLLPKLVQLMLDRAHNITDFGVAASLLNETVASMPLNDNTKELYDAVIKPFCAKSLAVGDLNGLSDKVLELLLTHTTNTEDFKTSEYDLLLCVIECVWARDTILPAAERRAIFDNINSLPTELSIKIHLQMEASRTSLLELLDHFELLLVCPHRLKCLIKSINVFDELPRYTWVFCYHACENIKCSPAHPSRFRGVPSFKLQWDQSDHDGLVYSEQGTIVKSSLTPRIVRASTKCSADPDGICKWTIIIVDSGGTSGVGLVEEFWDNSETYLPNVAWCFLSTSHGSVLICKGKPMNNHYEHIIQIGDVINFHLDLNNRTCALSINGHNHGIAWTDLPNVNLYPAVIVWPESEYQITLCD